MGERRYFNVDSHTWDQVEGRLLLRCIVCDYEWGPSQNAPSIPRCAGRSGSPAETGEDDT